MNPDIAMGGWHIEDRYTDSVLNGLRGSYNRINHAYYNHPLPLPVIGKYLDLSPYVEI